jgi:hypothetical protein
MLTIWYFSTGLLGNFSLLEIRAKSLDFYWSYDGISPSNDNTGTFIVGKLLFFLFPSYF